jgi:uncharacterized protein (DUF302 family)/uncharacterized membrane protein YidH (DUF202 family)
LSLTLGQFYQTLDWCKSQFVSATPRVYLAAERTFLAWIPTGLALMAFGFVVARFGLFLRELEASRGALPVAPSPLSLPLGVGLVLLGVLLNIFASWHHVRCIRELNAGSLRLGQPSRLAIVLALILALAGLALAFYLGTTTGRNSGPATINKESTLMNAGDGIISKPSKYSVPDTLDRLEAVLRSKGVRVFARVDHSGEAEKAGLKMPPTQLLIFGNPTAGTPVMLAASTAAIDLPLKALAWQDVDGKIWLSYNDPAYLKQRFGLNDDQVKTIVGTGTLIEQALN